MGNLYRITWQKKGDDNAPIIAGPILIHRKKNPSWAKEAAPYTHEEALAACERWNWFCPSTVHKVIKEITVLNIKLDFREEAYNERCT